MADQNPVPPEKSRLSGWLVFACKALVTGCLFWWLASSKTLQLGTLSVLVRSPRVLVATIVAWLVVSVALSTLRWRFLLSASDISIPLPRAAALQMMALFFNSVVPGNVGGDVLKNLYVVRGRRAHVFVMVVGERFIGLFGLIWIGALAVAGSLSRYWNEPRLVPLLLATAVLAAGTLLTPWLSKLFLRVIARRGETTRDGTEKTSGLGRALEALRVSLEIFHERRRQVLGAFVVSLAIHAVNMLYFYLIALELGNAGADLGRVALVYPLGMLTLILPISLSGLGVGHLAFEQLFTMVGLQGGANVFNVFIVGALAPCLIGAVPYLFLRREHGAPVLVDSD